MRSRLEGLVGGSESGLGYANFAAPARQPDGDIWRQMNIGVWDSGGKSKTEIDIWEVTLKISYSVEGLWMQSLSPKCFEVRDIRRSQLRHCEGSGQRVRQTEKRQGQLEMEVKIVSRRNYQLSQRLQEKTDEVCVEPEKWWESNTRSLTSLFLHATTEWVFMEIKCRAVKSL